MRARIRGTELYFDVDGVGLAPDEGAMVERPVLFLLHGGPGGDHSSFKSQLASLREIAQLVFVDHRGSGRSVDRNPETHTLDNNIDDLDALREHLGLDRISVLGASYGGMVAQGFAIRYPERVASLILSATAPSYRFIEDAGRHIAEHGTPDEQRVCKALWEGSFKSQAELYEYYRVMGPAYSRTFDIEKFERGWGRSIRNYEQLNRGFGGFLKDFDYTEDLHRISCPTLVLAGAHDWICPPHHSQLIAAKIPRAHLKVFRKSSHAIAADEPEAYQAAIRGFLTTESN